MRDTRELDSLVATYKSHTFAESTKSTYRHYLKSYLSFCKQIDIAVVPLNSTNLARYIAYLSKRLQYNSITNYLSVVRLLHMEAGVDCPIDAFHVQSVLKGVKRILGSKVCSKLPITPKILLQIFSKLALNSSQDLCFWAACLVAFFSFLRKSNLFCQSMANFDPNRHLSREAIKFHETGVSLTIKGTKTIQFSERTLDVPLPRIINSPLCPCQALLLNFKQVNATVSPSPAFLFCTEGNVQAMTYSLFLKRLKFFLSDLGYDCSNYSGHSFRRGGASFAFECGIPAELIQAQGDWKSDAYKSYIDPSFSHRSQVMSHFASALSNYT